MFPPRLVLLAFGLLLCLQSMFAQSVVNSAWVIRDPFGSADWTLYSNPNNWSPAEVPNNTPAEEFNVNITDAGVRVDIDATISNLTLAQKTDGYTVIGNTFIATGPGNVSVFGKTFRVRDTTFVEASGSGISITSDSSTNTPALCDAGTLTSFANHILTGNYTVANKNTPATATLQFRGADIWTFSGGTLNLVGGFSRIVDEAGNDALHNLAHVGKSGTLFFEDHNAVTNAPFFNEGSLTVSQNTLPASFTAAVSLDNFDASTRTLTAGSFTVSSFASTPAPVELRFNGADIVNVGTTILLRGITARITDLAGNDGLRNLARVLPAGSLTLSNHDLTAPGTFGNDGLITLSGSKFTVNGTFTNFDATSGTLSGGNLTVTAGQFKFGGADIVHNAASIALSFGGAITDLVGNNGLRNLSENLTAGNLVVGGQYLLTPPGDFTNAGRVETVVGTFSRFPPSTPTPTPQGRIVVPSGHRYIQNAGSTVNNGILTADRVDILAGTFSGNGTVNGNILVRNGVITPAVFTTIHGDLTLNPGSHFDYKDDERVPNAITGQVTLAGMLDVDIPSNHYVASTASLTVLKSSLPLTGTFANAPNGARIPTVDGKGSVVVTYDANSVYVGQYQAEPSPAQLLNISSRAFLSATADDPSGVRTVIIGGFVVGGSGDKEVVLRGLGPSLAPFGLTPVLSDPVLELHASNGSLIAGNDNWRENEAAIQAAGLAPNDDRESALRTTVAPGAYTVVVKEKHGQAGYALVEVYDISQNTPAKLANISTRGYVNGTDVLIGGIIAGGAGPGNVDVAVRALGRDLEHLGVSNYLSDPTLEIRNANGGMVGSADGVENDDELTRVNLHPGDPRDSALVLSLPPGQYTAIVQAKAGAAGVTTVEFYDLRL